MKTTFAAQFGPWALVTGASKGIGAEFARQLAARGLNLVLVATNADQLGALAAELEHAHQIATRVVPLDLSRTDIIEQLSPITDPLPIGLLVSNAGISAVGPFLEQSVEYLMRQLQINSGAGTILVHHFAKRLVQRGHGGIILVSSGSAQRGTPFSAHYAATKAYNLILAESLWYELAPKGIAVLGFMAGATKTEGWLSNHPKPAKLVRVMEPGPAVAQALRALGRGPSVAAGRLNRLGYAFMGLIPRARAVRILGSSMEKMFGPF